MHPDITLLSNASNGLYYLSESDFPFEAVELGKPASLESTIKKMSEHTEGPISKTTVEDFFRNMIRTYPAYNAQQVQLAQRFRDLQELLLAKLGNLTVYKVGEVQIDAFILGKLSDENIGGLRTKLIET